MFIIGPFFFRAYIRALKRLLVLCKKDENALTEEKLMLEMGQSYLNAGKIEQALDYYFQYLRKTPNDAMICFRVAKLLSSEQPGKAMIYLRRAALLGNHEAQQQLNSIIEKDNIALNKNKDSHGTR